ECFTFGKTIPIPIQMRCNLVNSLILNNIRSSRFIQREFDLYTYKMRSLIESEGSFEFQGSYLVSDTLPLFTKLEFISGVEKVYGEDILSYALANTRYEDYGDIDGFVHSLYSFPRLYSREFSKLIHNSITQIASNKNIYSVLNKEQNSLILKYGDKLDSKIINKMTVLDQFIYVFNVLYSFSAIPRKSSNEVVLSNGVTIPKGSETSYFMFSSVKQTKSKVVYIGENTWIRKLDNKSHIALASDSD
ncbi:hypothetical protein BB560_005260, partial [Smittium megazygosporum]